MRIASLIVLLLAGSAAAQAPIPKPHTFTPASVSPIFWGDVTVPATKTELAEMKAKHTIIFKRIVKPLPPNKIIPKSLTVWIFDNTHPINDGLKQHLKEGEAYDPRNIRVTTKYLRFDAAAGDHIFWRVGGNLAP